jgi:hypothetical protein
MEHNSKGESKERKRYGEGGGIEQIHTRMHLKLRDLTLRTGIKISAQLREGDCGCNQRQRKLITIFCFSNQFIKI